MVNNEAIIAELGNHPYTPEDKITFGGASHYCKVFKLGSGKIEIVYKSGNAGAICEAMSTNDCIDKNGIIVDGTDVYVLKETSPRGTFARYVVLETNDGITLEGIVDASSVSFTKINLKQAKRIELPNGRDGGLYVTNQPSNMASRMLRESGNGSYWTETLGLGNRFVGTWILNSNLTPYKYNSAIIPVCHRNSTAGAQFSADFCIVLNAEVAFKGHLQFQGAVDSYGNWTTQEHANNSLCVQTLPASHWYWGSQFPFEENFALSKFVKIKPYIKPIGYNNMEMGLYVEATPYIASDGNEKTIHRGLLVSLFNMNGDENMIFDFTGYKNSINKRGNTAAEVMPTSEYHIMPNNSTYMYTTSVPEASNGGATLVSSPSGCWNKVDDDGSMNVRCYGGSVCNNFFTEGDTYGYNKTYLEKRLPMTFTNKAIGGYGFAKTGALVKTQLTNDTGLANADMVILWVSTNDYYSSVAKGTYTDYTSVDSYDSTKLSTQCGGFNDCVKYIRTTAPKAKIVCFAPLKVMNASDEKVFDKNKADGFYAYAQEIVKACGRQGVPVLDLWDAVGVSVDNSSSYHRDNIHPNAKGYARIRHEIADFLRKHYNKEA